jgi:hypothetical protein
VDDQATALDGLPLAGWRAELLARCELALARANPHELAAVAKALEYRVKHKNAPLSQRSYLAELLEDPDDDHGMKIVNTIEEHCAAACQLRDLLAIPPDKLLSLPGFGPKSALELLNMFIRALPER